jgi:hypothetical protein
MRHRFHALCPYFAMFPESFVETWVGRLSKPGDVILDPFCGRGTTPFQSLLMGRNALACDVNPVAYCITKAKTNAPTATVVRRRVTRLRNEFDSKKWTAQSKKLSEFFHHAYSPLTLHQLLYLRSSLRWEWSDTDCMIAALILGSLHGESNKSSSYLSNQMPRTISTKPAYSVRFWQKHGYRAPERDAFELLHDRITYRYESDPPPARGNVIRADMRELPRLIRIPTIPIKCVITSPPYFNVTNFEEDQWLRLWFLGSLPKPTYGRVSRDDRHEQASKYWDLISDMWRVLGQILAPRANIVIRLGVKNLDPEQIGKSLLATSMFSRKKVSLVHSETSEIKGRQTDSFRPGSKGCLTEIDFHFLIV